MTMTTSSLRLALLLVCAAALALTSCNRHNVDGGGCLPACNAEDETLFEECVAFGGGPRPCRPGNRECCATSAGCLGPIGDQVVETSDVCGGDVVITLDFCVPPCAADPFARELWDECMSGIFPGCDAADDDCCAIAVGCHGSIAGVVIEVPGYCCDSDDRCASGDYCDPFLLECRRGDCVGCGDGRECVAGECACLNDSEEPVIQCGVGMLCGPEGFCVSANPCAGVACAADEACLPSESGDSGECFQVCGGSAAACAAGTYCDGFVCLPQTFLSCIDDSECRLDEWCDIEEGECLSCVAGLDLCDGADNDCDGSIDEDDDCFDDCGDGIVDPGEDCDGPESLRDTPCPISGFLGCNVDCTFDLFFCSVEICDNDLPDADGDLLADCDDEDCWSDPVCCTPTAEICNGEDDDCDYLTDEGCVPPPPEDCAAAGDEDGDGFADCLDSDCYGFPACCVPSGPEICGDSIDSDCDGSLVDDHREGQPCGDSVGVCVAGSYSCSPSGELLCGATTVTAEICDGLDNDCDDFVDEGPNPDRVCNRAAGGTYCGSIRSVCGSAGACILDSDGLDRCDDLNDCTFEYDCDEAARHCIRLLEPPTTLCSGEGMCSAVGECVFPG